MYRVPYHSEMEGAVPYSLAVPFIKHLNAMIKREKIYVNFIFEIRSDDDSIAGLLGRYICVASAGELSALLPIFYCWAVG